VTTVDDLVRDVLRLVHRRLAVRLDATSHHVGLLTGDDVIPLANAVVLCSHPAIIAALRRGHDVRLVLLPRRDSSSPERGSPAAARVTVVRSNAIPPYRSPSSTSSQPAIPLLAVPPLHDDDDVSQRLARLEHELAVSKAALAVVWDQFSTPQSSRRTAASGTTHQHNQLAAYTPPAPLRLADPSPRHSWETADPLSAVNERSVTTVSPSPRAASLPIRTSPRENPSPSVSPRRATLGDFLPSPLGHHEDDETPSLEARSFSAGVRAAPSGASPYRRSPSIDRNPLGGASPTHPRVDTSLTPRIKVIYVHPLLPFSSVNARDDL
jgi:hypothetical protein